MSFLGGERSVPDRLRPGMDTVSARRPSAELSFISSAEPACLASATAGPVSHPPAAGRMAQPLCTALTGQPPRIS
ncbi:MULTISPECIES: hypothetical protein [unclassified Frankia]|uniref:hypothetical protein n=1 Tax=unclassified Frankia TaxID=2632575 RepID=UPI001EF3D764|nr:MULTISPECIES: hypothetical protein [unclassified Frankia]